MNNSTLYHVGQVFFVIPYVKDPRTASTMILLIFAG